MPENEIWKPAPGFEHLYDVSNLGRIRNRDTGKIKSAALGGGGKLKVTLFIQNDIRDRASVFVHALVGRAFLKDVPTDTPVFFHFKDGDPGNPRASNLKWTKKRQKPSELSGRKAEPEPEVLNVHLAFRRTAETA